MKGKGTEIGKCFFKPTTRDADPKKYQPARNKAKTLEVVNHSHRLNWEREQNHLTTPG